MQKNVPEPSVSPAPVGVLKCNRPASNPTLLLTIFIFAANLLFVVFPSVDLAISSSFANGHSFPLSESSFLKAVRDINRQGLIYVIMLLLLSVGLNIILPRKFAFCPPHKALFVLLSFLLGPLITVHFLKNLIGRARPYDVVEFGGTADFSPVWQYAAACGHSCSFPSGEAAVAAGTLSLIVFVPLQWRLVTTVLAAPILFLVSFNRVLFGAHFLSDIIAAWGLVLFITMWLWQKISSQAAAIDDKVKCFGTRLSLSRAARRALDSSPYDLDKADEKSGARSPCRNGQ